MENKSNENTVTRSTLVWAVIVSLTAGFFCGSVFTSFKLASQSFSQEEKHIHSDSQALMDEEEAAHIASQIFQLEQSVKEDPENAASWKKLGDLFYDSDRYADAINAYERYLKLEPGNIAVITDMGTMYRLNKMPEKAIEIFDSAIKIDPKFEPPRFNKGLVLMHDLKDQAAGIKAWEELVRINPLAVAPNGESMDSIIQHLKNSK